MKTNRRLLLVLGLVAGLAGARDARAAESLFGLSFFGESTTLHDARIAGRAGMGLAYRDSVNSSVMQATQLADLARVTIGLTNTFGRRDSEDASGSITRMGLNTPTLRIGFPLLGRGGIGVGFQARRATQWTVERPFQQDADVIETIDRSGTLFDVPIQVGWRFGERVAVGAGLHLLRGNVRMDYTLDVENATNPEDTREDIYSGTATELSAAVYDLGPLSVAGHWIAGFDADVDVRQRGVALDDRTDATRTDEMPARFGVGVRLDLPSVWSVGVDYANERWSEYSGRGLTFDDDGNYDPQGTPAELQDEIEWRVGIEREARPRGFGATTPLRLGAYWRRWHYQLQGDDLTEWGLTLGTGVVLRGGTARADFAVGWSRIGDLDGNGAQEDVFRAMLSISGGERWY